VAKREVSKHPAPEPEPDDPIEPVEETNGESPETTEPVEETTHVKPETKPPAPETPHDSGARQQAGRKVGLLLEGVTAPQYVDNPNADGALTLRIRIGDTVYDHVSTDAEGVWLYRATS
jgi:hypothetical protein